MDEININYPNGLALIALKVSSYGAIAAIAAIDDDDVNSPIVMVMYQRQRFAV